MRACVAVLGPGRSGTSIAMQLLAAAGLGLSSDLVPASPANPDGHFEDVRIRDIQQRLMRSLRLTPYLPRPGDWTESPEYPVARQELIEIVKAEHSARPDLWGFKDPRTCILWPLWQDVARTVAVELRPVFCVRPGSDVIRSMIAGYGLTQEAAEGIYLYRVFHSLQDVSEGWFFVQYRGWHDSPEQQLRSLAGYCGLETAVPDYGELTATVFRPELDRQSTGTPVALSGVVGEVDELLGAFAGTSYDQAAIDDWCASVDKRIGDLRFVFGGIEALTQEAAAAQSHSMWRGIRRRLGRLRR